MTTLFALLLLVASSGLAATPAERVDYLIRQSTMAIPLDSVAGDAFNGYRIHFSTGSTLDQRRTAEYIAANADVSDATLAAFDTTEAAFSAANVFSQSRPSTKIQKAVLLTLLDELNNLRQWIAAFKVEVAAATTLADLKTRVAGLPAMPDRTVTQARTAIKDKLDTGAAN